MSGESNNSEMRAIRSRLDFSKIPTSIQIPNLIEVQRRSYERFLQMDKLPQEREEDMVGSPAILREDFAQIAVVTVSAMMRAGKVA